MLKRHPGLTVIPVGAAPEKEYIENFMDKNGNLKKAHFYQKKKKEQKGAYQRKKM